MNIEQKRQFVESVIGQLRDTLLRAVEKVPEEWDGFELRLLIDEKVAEHTQVRDIKQRMGYKRASDYRNTMKVSNL